MKKTIALLIGLGGLGWNQKFEVASIKPAATQPMNGRTTGCFNGDPGRMTCKDVSLTTLVMTGYDVRRTQIAGQPPWMEDTRFDVVATLPSGATRAELKPMIQNLLAERFKLMAHREKRDMPMYALVTGKGGTKLKVWDPAKMETPVPGGAPMMSAMGSDGCLDLTSQPNRPANRMSVNNGNACVQMIGQPLSALTYVLGNLADRPVVDMTGLNEKYNFTLSFDASVLRGMPSATADPTGPGRSPDVHVALQQQLGLKLDARKGPVEVLVIDHIEKTPTEN